MDPAMRRTGIDVIGDVPWGTHFCQFYEAGQDLIDILVPYFKEGLDAGEFCMWVTSEPLRVDQATAALKAAVPDLDDYINKGQIEILDYSQWYTRSGKFSADEVLKGWVDKLSKAQKQGFKGLRLTGNTFWLEKADWDDFTQYEETVNNVIGRYKMLAVCTYSLQKCNALEILDVVANHQFALIKRSGRWEIIESKQHKKTEQALRESEEKLSALYNSMVEGVALHEVVYDSARNPTDYIIIDVNPSFEKITGIPRDKALGKRASALYGTDEPPYLNVYAKVASSGKPESFETYFEPMKKHFSISVFSPSRGKFATVFSDITERKLMEEALQESREELEVQSEELEAQNEELRAGNDELAEAMGKLQESEARYKSLAENVPSVLMRYDRDFRVVYLSPQAKDITGIPTEQFIGKTNRQVGMPEDLCNTWEAAIQRVFQTGANQELEFEFPGADGSGLKAFYLKLAPEYAPDGDIVQYVLGISTDITERKMAEEALRESEEKYRLIVETAQEGIWVVDANRKSLYINERMAGMLGYTAQEMMGKPWTEFVTNITERTRSDQRVQERKQGIQHSSESYEMQFICKDGSVLWAIVNSTPKFNDHGEYIGSVSMLTDITERKRAEEALRESERRFRAAIDNFPYVFNIYDKNLRIQYINRAGVEKSGLSENQIIGHTDEELFPPEVTETYVDHLKKVLETKTMQSFESTHTLPTDTSTILVNYVPLLDDRGEISQIIGTTWDITGRKRIEEALRKSRYELELRVQERTAELQDAKENLEVINEELRIEIDEHERTEKELHRAKDAAEEAVKAKSLFLANMSHELRTPMNAVIGFTGLLLDEPLTPEQKDYLESIRNSGNALLALISDLLDFSCMERENVEIEDQPFDLRSCIEEALDLVSGDASKKNLDLAYLIDKDMPEAVTGDPARLRQVLVNLLGNAIKYTDEGEAVLSVSPNGQDEILFEIRDTGIGIPEEKMNILFQPFSRADESFSSGYEGAGLGLAISKKLVDMMGGRIWVESVEGKGSTFSFTIKAKAVPGKPKAVPTGIQPKLEGKNVLIVDDNKTNRIILGKQLHNWGMIPVPKPSGQEALALIRGGAHFDAAILDMNMPEMDGVALAKEIRKYKKHIHLILLSSAGQRGEPELFDASLNKPIKPAQLHKVLSDTLAVQQSRDEAESLGLEANHSPMRILLAEDNVSNQKVTLQMLKNLGYRADAVANGAEAIQALERQHYDLVLMDVKMPVLGGIEATRMIRERWPENGLKIIAITAYALHGDKEKCLEAGMDGYIAKPMQKEDLAEVLKRCALKAS